MTAAVWIALVSAVAVLVGQWATGRLFARLAAIEKKQAEIDTHLTATDTKVEAINEEGSTRSDKIQTQYWAMQTRLTVLETIAQQRQHTKEGDPWQRS